MGRGEWSENSKFGDYFNGTVSGDALALELLISPPWFRLLCCFYINAL